MNIDQLHKEVSYKAVTSSGPGGQHANKVATKVLLEWNATGSLAFAEAEHQRILFKLQNRLTKKGILQLSSQDSSCLLYTSPSPRDQRGSRMPSSA